MLHDLGLTACAGVNLCVLTEVFRTGCTYSSNTLSRHGVTRAGLVYVPCCYGRLVFFRRCILLWSLASAVKPGGPRA